MLELEVRVDRENLGEPLRLWRTQDRCMDLVLDWDELGFHVTGDDICAPMIRAELPNQPVRLSFRASCLMHLRETGRLDDFATIQRVMIWRISDVAGATYATDDLDPHEPMVIGTDGMDLVLVDGFLRSVVHEKIDELLIGASIRFLDPEFGTRIHNLPQDDWI